MPDSLFFLNAEMDGQCREEVLHGDLYLVRPVKIVRSMVLNGLGDGPKGGQLLPQDELDRCPIAAWNNIPLTLGHPFAMNEDVRQYRSANSADMLQRFQVGMILNAHRDDQHRIAGEAWLHADNCELAGGDAAKLVGMFRANQQAEISSAYHFRLDETTGNHEGTAFNAIQRDIHPDHVAILLGSDGACSNEDGCGLGVNAGCGPECDCAECKAMYSGPLATMATGIEKLVKLFTGGDRPPPAAVATNNQGGDAVEEIKTLDELYAAKEVDDSVKAQVRESIAFHAAETKKQEEAREQRLVELAANERVTFTLDELRTMSDGMLDKVAEGAKEPEKAAPASPKITANRHESMLTQNADNEQYTWVGGSTIPQNN